VLEEARQEPHAKLGKQARAPRSAGEDLAKDPAMPLPEQQREELTTRHRGHNATCAAEAAANGGEK